jgi:hypothetical protein
MSAPHHLYRRLKSKRFSAICIATALIMIWAVYCQYQTVRASVNLPAMTLTVMSSNGQLVVLHQGDIGALSAYTAWGGTINKVGSLKNRGLYTGVPINTLCNLVGGIQKGQTLRVTGSDGYNITFTYKQVNGDFVTYNNVTGVKVAHNQPLTTILAYYLNGKNLTSNGPLRFAIVGPEGLCTNSTYWVSYVVKLEILGTVPTVTISPNSATIDLGQSKTFTSSVSNGTPPYAYRWYVNSSATSAIGSSYTFTPSSRGHYDFYLNVTDKNNATALSNIAVVLVSNAPAVTISPNSATIDLGQSKTFTSSVSNGIPPYSYQWYLNGSTISHATNSTWTFTPTSAGTYTVYVNVTDSASVDPSVQSPSVQITVNAKPTVAITPASATINVGKFVTFMSSVTGGTTPYYYQWYQNSLAVQGANNPTWTFSPTSTGTCNVYLNITDNVGITTRSNVVPVTVNPLPSVGGYSFPTTWTTTLVTYFLVLISFLTVGFVTIKLKTKRKTEKKRA